MLITFLLFSRKVTVISQWAEYLLFQAVKLTLFKVPSVSQYVKYCFMHPAIARQDAVMKMNGMRSLFILYEF